MCLKKQHQTLGAHLLQFIFFFSSPICEERNPQKCVLQKSWMSSTPASPARPGRTCFDPMTSWIWFATRSNPAARLLIIPNSYYRLQNVSSHHNIIVSTIPNIFFFFSFFFPACCSPFVQGKRQNPNKNYYPLLYKPVSQRSFQKVGWKPNQKASDFVSQNLPFSHPRSSLPFSLLASQRERDLWSRPLLLSSRRTCNRRRPVRVLCREGDSLRRRPLQSFSSLVRRTLPAHFATTVRSSSECKRTGSEEWRRILQSGTGTRIVYFFKIEIF